MSKLITTLSLMTMLFVLNGCGGSQSGLDGDAIMKQQIKEMNELAIDLEDGKIDREEMMVRSLAIGKKAGESGLSESEKNKLMEKYKAETDKVEQRINTALLMNAAAKMKEKRQRD